MSTAQQVMDQLADVQTQLADLREKISVHHAEHLKNEIWTTAAAIYADFKIARPQLEKLVDDNIVKKSWLSNEQAESLVRYSLTSLNNHIESHATLPDGLNGKLAKSILEAILEDKKDRIMGKQASRCHGAYWDSKKKKFIAFDNRDGHCHVKALDNMAEVRNWLTTNQESSEEIFA